MENENKIRKKFLPIDIIYEPLSNQNDIINYYFSDQINLSLVGSWLINNKSKNKWSSAWQCYFCSNYFAKQLRFDSHIKHCTGQPGIIYNFNARNLVTFVDYIKYKGDIPLSVYINLETNSPAELGLAPKDRSMFAICYVIVFAFHPYPELDRVIIKRSFGHSLEKLTSLDYLTREQLFFHVKTTLLKLRDI